MAEEDAPIEPARTGPKLKPEVVKVFEGIAKTVHVLEEAIEHGIIATEAKEKIEKKLERAKKLLEEAGVEHPAAETEREAEPEEEPEQKEKIERAKALFEKLKTDCETLLTKVKAQKKSFEDFQHEELIDTRADEEVDMHVRKIRQTRDMYALKKEDIMRHHTPAVPYGVAGSPVFEAKDLLELVDNVKAVLKEHLDGILEQTKLEKRMEARQALALLTMLKLDEQLKQLMNEIKVIAEGLLQAADKRIDMENPIYKAYDSLHTLLEAINTLVTSLEQEDAIIKTIARTLEQRKEKYANVQTNLAILKRTAEAFTPEDEFRHKIDITKELDGMYNVASSGTAPIKEADGALVLGIAQLKKQVQETVSPQVVIVERSLEEINKTVLKKKSKWDEWVDKFHRK